MEETEKIKLELEVREKERAISNLEENDYDKLLSDPDPENDNEDEYPESFPAEVVNQHDIMMKVMTTPDTERISFLDAPELESVRKLKNIVSFCALTNHKLAGAYLKRQARIIEGSSLSKHGKLIDNMITLKQEKKQNYPDPPMSEPSSSPSTGGLKNLFKRGRKKKFNPQQEQ